MIINKNQIFKCNDFLKIWPFEMDFKNSSVAQKENNKYTILDFFILEWKLLR